MNKPISAPNSHLLDISGIDKAELLQALQAAASVLLSGGPYPEQPMTLRRAEQLIDMYERLGFPLFFARIDGRILSVDISGDILDSAKYDWVNSHKGRPSAAKAVVDYLRRKLALEIDRAEAASEQKRNEK